MMSGTSFDAIDDADAELRMAGDVLEMRPLGMVSGTYPDWLRQAIARALPPAATTMAEVCRLDTDIGQTLFHWVEEDRVRGTLQLGQPAWIAERTGCAVVADLRSRDVAAGGQGAPLVSAFDVLWLRGRPGRPVALNLGGIANVTVAGGGQEAIASLRVLDSLPNPDTSGDARS